MGNLEIGLEQDLDLKLKQKYYAGFLHRLLKENSMTWILDFL